MRVSRLFRPSVCFIPNQLNEELTLVYEITYHKLIWNDCTTTAPPSSNNILTYYTSTFTWTCTFRYFWKWFLYNVTYLHLTLCLRPFDTWFCTLSKRTWLCSESIRHRHYMAGPKTSSITQWYRSNLIKINNKHIRVCRARIMKPSWMDLWTEKCDRNVPTITLFFFLRSFLRNAFLF